jgi:hypothetical protein
MLVVEELYKEAVKNTARKLIIFNGELDRIRSGCILCQFYMVHIYIFDLEFSMLGYLCGLDAR